jgi:hypothetical protein
VTLQATPAMFAARTTAWAAMRRWQMAHLKQLLAAMAIMLLW